MAGSLAAKWSPKSDPEVFLMSGLLGSASSLSLLGSLVD